MCVCVCINFSSKWDSIYLINFPHHHSKKYIEWEKSKSRISVKRGHTKLKHKSILISHVWNRNKFTLKHKTLQKHYLWKEIKRQTGRREWTISSMEYLSNFKAQFQVFFQHIVHFPKHYLGINTLETQKILNFHRTATCIFSNSL